MFSHQEDFHAGAVAHGSVVQARDGGAMVIVAESGGWSVYRGDTRIFGPCCYSSSLASFIENYREEPAIAA
jgi:hypothetical protein